MEEIWKEVKGYEGMYEVSNTGKIRSLYPCNYMKLLSQMVSTCGYYRVQLYNKNTKEKKKFKVHQIMAITFLGHTICRFKKVVDHINNIKTDNRLENLQIVTNRFNSTKDRTTETGHNNIYFSQSKNYLRYRVRFVVDGKIKSFGTYKTIEEAISKKEQILATLD